MNTPGTNGIPWMQIERPQKVHACDSVKFTKDVPTMHSATLCTCGWFGLLQDYPLHAPGLGVSVPGREHDYYGARGRITAPSRFVR